MELAIHTAVKNGLDIDDAKQDAYFGFLNAVKLFDGSVKFKTYASKRIAGFIVDESRKMQPFKRNKAYVSVAFEDAGLSYKLDESGMDFERMISGLGDKAKEYMRLHFIGDFTLNEIGEMFGLAKGSVSGSYTPALNKLKVS
jgi:RNA polymerase sigma factor (sigma-70 family)